MSVVVPTQRVRIAQLVNTASDVQDTSVVSNLIPGIVVNGIGCTHEQNDVRASHYTLHCILTGAPM